MSASMTAFLSASKPPAVRPQGPNRPSHPHLAPPQVSKHDPALRAAGFPATASHAAPAPPHAPAPENQRPFERWAPPNNLCAAGKRNRAFHSAVSYLAGIYARQDAPHPLCPAQRAVCSGPTIFRFTRCEQIYAYRSDNGSASKRRRKRVRRRKHSGA